MDKKTAKQVSALLDELSKMEEIRDAMRKEVGNWWGFITPDTRRRDPDGLIFPETFRKEFSIAVASTIEKMNRQLEEL